MSSAEKSFWAIKLIYLWQFCLPKENVCVYRAFPCPVNGTMTILSESFATIGSQKRDTDDLIIPLCVSPPTRTMSTLGLRAGQGDAGRFKSMRGGCLVVFQDCELDDKPEVRLTNKMNSTDTMMSGIRT